MRRSSWESTSGRGCRRTGVSVWKEVVVRVEEQTSARLFSATFELREGVLVVATAENQLKARSQYEDHHSDHLTKVARTVHTLHRLQTVFSRRDTAQTPSTQPFAVRSSTLRKPALAQELPKVKELHFSFAPLPSKTLNPLLLATNDTAFSTLVINLFRRLPTRRAAVCDSQKGRRDDGFCTALCGRRKMRNKE